MSNFEARAGLWHAALLCLIAGFVDAVGYIDLGHVFTANMTGNTVLLGVALANGDWIALSYAGTIAAFAVGVVASTLLKLAGVPLPFLFVLAAVLLISAAADKPGPFTSLSVLAFVMGLQGGAISTFSGIRLPTVVVTSTLVNLIDGLLRRGLKQTEPSAPSPSQIRHLVAAWIAYGGGGAAAVLAKAHLAAPLAVPVVLYAIVAVGLLRHPARA
jgi:uncharacterized membrane protein YoaK (UPF0700 family)